MNLRRATDRALAAGFAGIAPVTWVVALRMWHVGESVLFVLAFAGALILTGAAIRLAQLAFRDWGRGPK